MTRSGAAVVPATRKIAFRKSLQQSSLGTAFFTILLLLLGVVMAFPFFWMIRTALVREVYAPIFPPIWIPPYLELDGYRGVFTVQPFARYIFNSAFVAVAGMAS